jgi:hypothetical protein
MPTNNSRDKTVLSCRRDIVGTLPSHFFKPTVERFQRKPPLFAEGGGEGDGGSTGAVTGSDEQESSFVELELVGSNVRLRLGEHLRRTGWTLCHSDMSSSSSSCASQSSNCVLMIEHSFRDRWYLD